MRSLVHFNVQLTLPLLAFAAVSSCGDDSTTTDGGFDASISDASSDVVQLDTAQDTPGVLDVGTDQFVELDAAEDGGAEDRFGVIAGPCAVLQPEDLASSASSFHSNAFDFRDDPFDDPEDIPRLTEGAQEVFADGTLGGSSIVSEMFAYEVLARCENATLRFTEPEIEYVDPDGKKTDQIVDIDDIQYGISVTRAVGFPRDAPYEVSQAESLLMNKLADALAANDNVAGEFAWARSILVVMAYGSMHVESLELAWENIEPSVRGDTIVYVIRTDGMDGSVYGD